MDFRATFDNSENVLIPGDFVKVKVYSNQKNNVLVIPQDIVLQDSKGRFVYVVEEDNTVGIRYFKDNGQYDKYWIVKSGLKKDEKYISTNITKLMPKMKVKKATADAKASSAEEQAARNDGDVGAQGEARAPQEQKATADAKASSVDEQVKQAEKKEEKENK